MLAGTVTAARYSFSSRSLKKVVAKTLSQHLSACSRVQSVLNSGSSEPIALANLSRKERARVSSALLVM